MTLYISDTKHYRVVVLSYIGVSAFCGLFTCVYNSYGHGVLSGFMNFLFLPPLLFGVVIPSFAAILHLKQRNTPSLCCYHGGIASLTLYFAVRGILDIAKTTSPYLPVYLILTVTMFGVFAILAFRIRTPQK